MNLKRRRWFSKVLKRLLMGHSAKQREADRKVLNKVFKRFLEGKIVCRPVYGQGIHWAGYRKGKFKSS